MATFGPMIGANQHHHFKSFGQPSSSADSQQTHDSPRSNVCGTAAARSTPDMLCTEYSFGQFDGHIALGEHQQTTSDHSVPLQSSPAIALLSAASPAAVAAALNDIPDDPVAAKAAFKQLTSHMSPTEMAEMQELLRAQRLQRQQQDMLAMLSAGNPRVPALGLPAGPLTPGVPAAMPSLAPNQFAGLPQQGLNPADAMRVIGEVAVALNAAIAPPSSTSSPTHFASCLAAIASQLAMHQTAPMQYEQTPQQHQQQQHYNPVISAAAAAGPEHPGITSCRGTRSNCNRNPRISFVCLPWHSSTPAEAPVEAATEQPLVPAKVVQEATTAAEAPAAAGAVQEPTDSTLKARFARLSADAQASVMAQLQQLEASEAEQRAAREARRAAKETAATTNAQRKSVRARRLKSPEDADNLLATNNSTRSVSPDPAAAADRAGSTEANNSTAPHPAAGTPQQHHQQQQAKKRVRFAFAEDEDDSDADEHVDAAAVTAAKKARSRSSSESPQCQGSQCTGGGLDEDPAVFLLEEDDEPMPPVRRVVRRVGPRAQARKRMHKKTIRRRRPQRAPLS